VLDHAGLTDCFKAISSASDGVRGKPAPDLYLLAVAKLRDVVDVSAASCVAIEDSHWGLESARVAGLRTVAVTHTYPAGLIVPLLAGGIVIALLGALLPASWAARSRTATALRTE